jgi:hypothetical protein
MKRLIIILAILLGLALVMKVTVPSMEKHKEAAVEQVTKFVEEQMMQNDEVDGYLEAYGIDKDETHRFLSENGIYKSMVTYLVENSLFLEDYFVCNVGKFQYEGEIYPLTLGLFNHVFVLTDYIDEMQEAQEKMEKLQQKLE